MTLMLPIAWQPSSAVALAVKELSEEGSTEELGAVFTRLEVVQGILDLCQYRSEHDLVNLRLLEPSAGSGEFLFEAISRLLDSCRLFHGPVGDHIDKLKPCIRAVELHKATFTATMGALVDMLVEADLPRTAAQSLASTWFKQGDFLLVPLVGPFDVVVGNPPYVRQERIPEALLAEYRRRYTTLYDRADLYIPFYERGLDLLREGGVLGYICANRWIKNRYGGPLREKVTSGYNLDVYIDLAYSDAFHESVDAYPAITLISRAKPSVSRVVAGNSRAEITAVQEIFSALLAPSLSNEATKEIHIVQQLGQGRDPWLLDNPGIIKTLRHLEETLPNLEEAGIRVGIGVATGADAVYIRDYDSLPVESARKLRLAMSGDISDSRIQWRGFGVVNPWDSDGALAPLADYPRFSKYLLDNETTLRRRHTAKKSPHRWYKTIDRIYPKLTTIPKLLIPDIKGEPTVAYDEGNFYPHHNLYVVTSDTWELKALQAILRSSISLTFVAAYCVRMAGGFLRFQAQYLRRIRVPNWLALTPEIIEELISVRESDDITIIDEVVFRAYGLSKIEQANIRDFAMSARVTSGES